MGLSGRFNAIFGNMLGKKRVPVSVLVSWVALASLVLVSSYSLIVGDSQILSSSIKQLTTYDWTILVGLSMTSIVGFLCLTVSLQMAPPPLIVRWSFCAQQLAQSSLARRCRAC